VVGVFATALAAVDVAPPLRGPARSLFSSPRSMQAALRRLGPSLHPATRNMAMSSYNPDRFMSAMERFFDDLEPRWARAVVLPRVGSSASGTLAAPAAGKTAVGAMWRPSCDVRENDKEFLIQAEVPGARKEDLHLELDGNNLRISGEVHDEKTSKGDNFYHSERSYGKFSRMFAMPENADLDKIKAEHVNGVLHVTVPKKAQPEPAKRTIALQ
jgi:HSP20 family protein